MQIQKTFCTFVRFLRVNSLTTTKMTQPTANMTLQLNELEQGKHHYSFHLGNAYFREQEKSEIQGGEVDVEADLTLYESDYTLHLKAQGEVKLICDRCLGEMNYAVDVEDDIQPNDQDEQSDTLDLNWLAYEMITINLPLVHSHPEGACMDDMQQLLQAHLCSTVEDPNDSL